MLAATPRDPARGIALGEAGSRAARGSRTRDVAMRRRPLLARLLPLALGALALAPGGAPPTAGLVVRPAAAFAPSGAAGGPFERAASAYALANDGSRPLALRTQAGATWLAVEPQAGTLAPGEESLVRVALVPAEAARLLPGVHAARVRFEDAAGVEAAVEREVALRVRAPPGLAVVPAAPFEARWADGPEPAAQLYEVRNAQADELAWTVEPGADWLAVAPRAGRLARGERALVQVVLVPERAPRAAGVHEARLVFRDARGDEADAERLVRLRVAERPGLVVSPGSDAPAAEAGYELANRSDAALRWRAATAGAGLAALPPAGELAPGASVRVRVVRAAQDGAGLVAFVNDTDGRGTTTRRVGAGPGQATSGARSASVSRSGITWTFARDERVGRFANGDWWVVGPVALVAITPGSARAGPRVLNGSMRNPSPRDGGQGYDSAMFGPYRAPGSYDDARNAGLDVSPQHPLLLAPGTSLVSTVSEPAPGARPQLAAAAILTVLAEPAPDDAFRPPYCGADKTPRHRAGALRRELLPRLAPAPGMPPLREVEGWFERPWLDHVPDWLGRYCHPAQNMPDYGREMCDAVGTASLVLLLDLPPERKETLLVRFVQLGIDLYGIVQDGGEDNWPPGGGHHSGRKWPILFAGLLLDDPGMRSIGARADVQWNEDGQTFYVEETAPGVFNEGHGGYGPEHVGLAEWGNQHAKNRAQDDARWTDTDGSNPHLDYRTCCTANVWWGEVLAARVLGARELWRHDALFDYLDRYRAVCRTSGQSGWTVARTPFALAMWDRYRESY